MGINAASESNNTYHLTAYFDPFAYPSIPIVNILWFVKKLPLSHLSLSVYSTRYFLNDLPTSRCQQ